MLDVMALETKVTKAILTTRHVTSAPAFVERQPFLLLTLSFAGCCL